MLLVNDRGDSDPEEGDPMEGVYYRDERYLKKLTLKLNGLRPEPIAVRSTPLSLVYLYEVPRGVKVRREQFISRARLKERLSVLRGGPVEVEIEVTPSFEDVFEVRGFFPERPLRRKIVHKASQGRLSFAYEGRDGLIREVTMSSSPTLKAEGTRLRGVCEGSLEITVVLRREKATDPDDPRSNLRKWLSLTPSLRFGRPTLNVLYLKATLDIFSLLLDPNTSLMVNAGAPSFLNPFGRDSIIVAFQLLPFVPDVARSVLRFLAKRQGTRVDRRSEEEPGKIMHELRYGELTLSGMLPFNPYYGSVDSTPLFLWLYSEYVKWTGDLELGRELYPHALAALKWIINYGDMDGDGLVEYTPGLLANKGWKDSPQSVFHSDGSLANPPIALIEVQGYVHAAIRSFEEAVKLLGLEPPVDARRLADKVSRLVEEKFWSPRLRYYGMALDGEKKVTEVVTSNPGHLLWTGTLREGRVGAVAKVLLDGDLLWTGYGIKTLAWGQPHHDEVSYHNGSVWPHDNAIIALGLSRYGFKREAAEIAKGLIDAAKAMPDLSMPECFSGTKRSLGPPKPLGCAPQAWSAGSLFMLLISWLNPSLNVEEGELLLEPWLPRWVEGLKISGFKVWGESLSLEVKGWADSTQLRVEGGRKLRVSVLNAR